MRESVLARVKTRNVLSTTIAGVAAAGVTALAIGWLVGSGAASAGGAPGWTTYSDRAHGFTISFPSAWHRARRPLVSRLVDPAEFLSVGTGPLKVGGGGDCGRYPAKALAAMGSRDVLISAQEEYAPPGARWLHEMSRRPRHFRVRPRSPAREAFYRKVTAVRGFSPQGMMREFDFRARGRAFWVLLAMGRSVQPKVRVAALRVLDSLRFGPTASR